MKSGKCAVLLCSVLSFAAIGCNDKSDDSKKGGGSAGPEIATQVAASVTLTPVQPSPENQAANVSPITITTTDGSGTSASTINAMPDVRTFALDPSQNPTLNGNAPIHTLPALPEPLAPPSSERDDASTEFDYVLAKDIQTHNTAAALEAIKSVRNINGQDNRGQTLLFLAAQVGDDKVVKALLSKNANVNIADQSGTTPLLVALEGGFQKVAKLLLIIKEIDVNAGRHGWTPLHEVAAHCDVKMAKLLFARKADPKVVSFYNWTALDIAIYAERDPMEAVTGKKSSKSKNAPIVRLIRSNGGVENNAVNPYAGGAIPSTDCTAAKTKGSTKAEAPKKSSK